MMNYAPDVPEITVQELQAMMEAGETPFILDVREENEFDVANLNGTLIPLQQLPTRLDELEAHRDELVVVHCRSGARSAQASLLLSKAGREAVANLSGGMLRWRAQRFPVEGGVD